MSAELVLGTMTFGDTVDAAGAAAMLDLAEEAGITMLDTANVYAGGACEEILGGLLAGGGRRDRFRIASKAGMPHEDAAGAAPLSAGALRRSVEGSLRRLRTDRLDLFYLHQPDRDTEIVETLDALAALAAEGLIREVGVSNYPAWRIAELRAEARLRGAPVPAVSQSLYNLIARRVEEEYAEYAASAGISTIVYNPLGGGLLTGRHRFEEPPEHGRFGDSRLAAMYRERYWDRQLFAAVTELTVVADGLGVPLPELALRWLMDRPLVNGVLVGSSTLGHLRANITAAGRGPLPPEALDRIDAVWQTLRGPAPAYHR
ncbi:MULTISPECIES: aldo/keto reductase [unclassified Streptomyces]|uniref:aldo/keto reductase n=1 Tax=Streptomyces TaxID=1883 RepID=UPI0019032B27|nr:MULTISPECIES: aldo/keto reductase [unclassified Streptomyces]MCU4747986.1 aldo/keto reductase [Streptomyces sp. G-5]QQN78599.1 aldo/keto reductase [Streptomyces sp. XC 2026]